MAKIIEGIVAGAKEVARILLTTERGKLALIGGVVFTALCALSNAARPKPEQTGKER